MANQTCKHVTKYLTYFIIRLTHVIYSKVTQDLIFVLLKIYMKIVQHWNCIKKYKKNYIKIF